MKAAALLLVIIASATGYAAAAADEQDADPLAEPVQRAASMLAQRGDADSLAAAAVLTLTRDRAEAEQLAARASSAAPKRPGLLWLHAQLCQNVAGCERQPLDAKLRALDPENGVTFLPALTDAARIPDPAQIDRLLAALAASKKIDLYWNSLIARLATAVASTGTLTASQSAATVTGLISAVAIPAFAAAARPCRDDELQREGRRARCQGIARALQQGDTAIAEMAGVGMANRLWPQDAPEARAAREARRTFDYRTSIWNERSSRLLSDEAAVHRYLEQLARYRREQDVIVAEIVAAGRNPTPPADWRPAPRAGAPGPAAR